MPKTTPTNEQLIELWNVCSSFVKDQRLHCPETTCEDRVYEHAPDFVYNVCEVVGYYDLEEEDDANSH